MPFSMPMPRSTCLCAPLSCLCLDLHVYVILAMSMPRSISLSALCLVHMSRSTSWLLCHVLLKLFYLLLSPFSRVLALLVGCRSRSCGLNLHPYTQAYIKGLDHFLYTCLCFLACFYALSPCLPIQIQALQCFVPSVGLCLSVFEANCLCGYICPSQGLFECNHFEIRLCGVGVLDAHLSLFCVMLLCLPCMLCATHLAFFASLHLCTFAYLVMHESVCHP